MYHFFVLVFQLRIRARDFGTPERFSTIIVRVTVTGETEIFQFDLPNYVISVAENVNISYPVLDVNAGPGVG